MNQQQTNPFAEKFYRSIFKLTKLCEKLMWNTYKFMQLAEGSPLKFQVWRLRCLHLHVSNRAEQQLAGSIHTWSPSAYSRAGFPEHFFNGSGWRTRTFCFNQDDVQIQGQSACGKLRTLRSSLKAVPRGLKWLDLLSAPTSDPRDSRVMSGCQTGHYQRLKSGT